ncbi:hypothetical protein ABW19_dt0200870 [Dactylella cylindrospora]|nr:hypothetical protein ABW19_dt0200870 [Dactylella cylindrospora]
MSPRLPPTPKPSTELAPRRTPRLSIDSSFNIGPAAITLSPEALKLSSTTHVPATVTPPVQPLSPTSPFSLTAINPQDVPKTQQKRRASSSASTTAAKRKDVVIGPPPTRQHPIIQMKPREVAPATITEDTTAKAVAGSKRKATGVSAAKRKIARKTAHSEIERRRRSKMNDQFAKLKSMVPACKNQDMHKLAILEATTEYLAYLEEAIKVYRNAGSDSVINSPPTFSASESGQGDDVIDYDDEDDEDAEDVAVASADTSPALEAITNQQSVLEITDTEATHALLLLADHQTQQSTMERIINFGKSKPISVKDLLL